MSKPPQLRTDPAQVVVAVTTPAPIRLVQVFKEAVELSRRLEVIEEEVFEVESLLIAAVCSFDALCRHDEHWHQGVYGDPPVRLAGPEQTLLDGYDIWRDAADAVEARVTALEARGFESARFDTFRSACHKVDALRRDARSRQAIDRRALRVDRLEGLAAKVRPSQPVYDDTDQPS
jgi:hypothetical protein